MGFSSAFSVPLLVHRREWLTYAESIRYAGTETSMEVTERSHDPQQGQDQATFRAQGGSCRPKPRTARDMDGSKLRAASGHNGRETVSRGIGNA